MSNRQVIKPLTMVAGIVTETILLLLSFEQNIRPSEFDLSEL